VRGRWEDVACRARIAALHAAVDAAFHHVAGNLLVLDALGQPREILDTLGAAWSCGG